MSIEESYVPVITPILGDCHYYIFFLNLININSNSTFLTTQFRKLVLAIIYALIHYIGKESMKK